MILVTTSRKPSRNTRIFARNLANLIPNALYAARGKASVDDIASLASSKGLAKIAIACDRKGNPGRIEFISVSRTSWDWGEPLFIKSVSLTKNKKAFDAIKIDDKLSEILGVESDEEAELSAVWENEEITFAFNGDKLMIIKVGGKQNG